MHDSHLSRIALKRLLLAAGLLLSAASLAATAIPGAAPQLAAGTGGNHPAAPGSGSSGPSGNAGTHGSASASGGAAGEAAAAGSGSAAAAGQKVFQSAMPPCSTCHQVKAGVDRPAPSLAGVAARAKQRIAAKDYKGKARDARSYIRESIMDPNAYIVPGQGYAAGGQSLMPRTYAQALKPEQIEELVNYVMSLK